MSDEMIKCQSKIYQHLGSSILSQLTWDYEK